LKKVDHKKPIKTELIDSFNLSKDERIIWDGKDFIFFSEKEKFFRGGQK